MSCICDVQIMTVFILLKGALNLTHEAQKRSQKAQEAADATEADVADSERQCKRTETIVNRTADQFYRNQQENEDAFETLTERLKELETQIPDLNELVSITTRSKLDIILYEGISNQEYLFQHPVVLLYYLYT